MEKDYQLPEEHDQTDNLNDPMYEYNIKQRYSPPLTEEELADSLTSDEFWGGILDYVDELFNKK